MTTLGTETPLTDPYVGFGMTRPPRRLSRDWATAGGRKLLESCLGQLLGTRASSERFEGELPWRPEFGSRLYLLRHIRNTSVAEALARVYVLDAVQRWEPRVRIKDVMISRAASDDGGPDTILRVRVVWDLLAERTPGARVIIADAETIVPVV